MTLPLDEYNRLLDLAAKPVKTPETPPLPYTIGSAELKLEVAGSSASGMIQLQGEIPGKGAVKVPLMAGMVILDAVQGGDPATPIPAPLETGMACT